MAEPSGATAGDDLPQSGGGAPKTLYYVLVSVPAPEGPEPVYRQHCDRTADVAATTRLGIPALKVGTLDALLSLSDQLSKLDGVVEGTVRRMNQTLGDLVNANPVWVIQQSLLPDAYLSQFQWDLKKFAPEKPLATIVATIQATVEKADAELRTRNSAYTALARAIASESRKEAGTLVTRSLADIVKPEHLIETEYLTTLLVVVPKHMQKAWLATYEELTAFVLPRSAVQLKEDVEFVLYAVTVFKRVAEEFKNKAREARYTVREFTKEQFSKESREERERRVEEKGVQEARLIKWIKATIGDVFLNWVHLKIVRAHVESVLRYGVESKYALFLMKPHKRDEKRVMASLLKVYAGISAVGSALLAGAEDPGAGAAAPGGQQEKYYPFVYSVIDMDLSHSSQHA